MAGLPKHEKLVHLDQRIAKGVGQRRPKQGRAGGRRTVLDRVLPGQHLFLLHDDLALQPLRGEWLRAPR